MPTELKYDSVVEDGIRITRIKTSKRLTSAFMEHLRGRYIPSFDIQLNAESSDEGVFDMFTLEGSMGEKATQSFSLPVG